MVYVFVLTFDPETEATIHAIWQRVSQKGYPSALEAEGYRPHISLGVYDAESFDIPACYDLIAAYARRTRPFPIQISHLGVFVNMRNVVFLGVTPSRDLLTRHKDLTALCRHHLSGLHPYYFPDEWTPHITLGFDLSHEQTLGILSLGWEMGLPISGEVQAVQIVELAAAGARNLFGHDFTGS